MDIDRARQRDPVDRQFLVMSAPGRKAGEKNPDDRDEPDNETQPNHVPTRKVRSQKKVAVRTIGRLYCLETAPSRPKDAPRQSPRASLVPSPRVKPGTIVNGLRLAESGIHDGERLLAS
jgi:hypothetical protein